MWEIEPTSQWPKDVKFYEKKRPDALAAVLRNLERYIQLLNTCKNSKAVHAGFLHPEPLGIIAIDQKGMGRNLPETRLYTYADDQNKVLYLITIGNKSEQPTDIALAKDFVENLDPQD